MTLAVDFQRRLGENIEKQSVEVVARQTKKESFVETLKHDRKKKKK